MDIQSLRHYIQGRQVSPQVPPRLAKQHVIRGFWSSLSQASFAFYKSPHDLSTHPYVGQFCNLPQSGRLYAACDEEGFLSVLDTDTTAGLVEGAGSCTSRDAYATARIVIPAHANAIFDVMWSADDTALFTASGDQLVRMWDVETGRMTAELAGHSMSVKCVSQMSNHPHVFASGARDGDVCVWDIRTSPLSGAMSPSRRLRQIHGSGTFQSPSSKRRRNGVVVPNCPQQSVTCVAFAQNDSHLATAGAADGYVFSPSLLLLSTAAW
jgi:WD40 repeat protein